MLEANPIARVNSYQFDYIKKVCDAVIRKDVDEFQRLQSLSHDYDVDLTTAEVNKYGFTLFHLIAFCGRHRMIDYLLELGVDVDIRDEKMRTPLHFACSHVHKSTSIKLISKKARVNSVDFKKWTPLHYALNKKNLDYEKNGVARNKANWELIETLMLAGANPDYPTSVPLETITSNPHDIFRIKSLHLLYKAWKTNDSIDFERIITELYELETSYNIPDLDKVVNVVSPYYKQTLLHHLISEIKPALIKILMQICSRMINLEKLDELEGKTAINLALEVGNHEIMDELLSVEYFFKIVKLGDENIDYVKKIMTERLLNSRLVGQDSITPLHRAAGHNFLQIAEFFLNEGAFVDAIDELGRTPIHYAAHYGHLDMISLLVRFKAAINKSDIEGTTPLHIAAKNSNELTCLKLVQLGADIYAKNNDKKIPFDEACSEEVAKVLRPPPIKHDDLTKLLSTDQKEIYLYWEEKKVDKKVIDVSNEHQYGTGPDDILMLDSTSPTRLLSGERKGDTKLIKLQEDDFAYKEIKKRMKETIRSHPGGLCGPYSDYNITSITKVYNDKLFQNYRRDCDRLRQDNDSDDANECMLFHGSSNCNSIITRGFDERYANDEGMFGKGIYFAKHSSKSNQYTFPESGCEIHQDKTCFLCERSMIYSQVALGRIHDNSRGPNKFSSTPIGYDSLVARPEKTGSLAFPEYVIYRGQQAYPLYYISYKIVP